MYTKDMLNRIMIQSKLETTWHFDRYIFELVSR